MFVGFIQTKSVLLLEDAFFALLFISGDDIIKITGKVKRLGILFPVLCFGEYNRIGSAGRSEVIFLIEIVNTAIWV